MTDTAAADVPGPILVVDDDTVSRLVLAHMLRRLGFTVVEAEDLGPAMALVLAGDFAVVFSDYSMPGGTGLELLAGLLPMPGRPRFVLVTGIVDRADRDADEAAAVDAFLVKPVSTRALRACLRTVQQRTESQP
jgi:two-component system chemotaxis response regulator CheY